ncbi:MAG: hypothetical protein QNJ27_00055 [Simkaniaceae bacterium]|nr:hypothetical protein [Simkaniaceae bacterium]
MNNVLGVGSPRHLSKQPETSFNQTNVTNPLSNSTEKPYPLANEGAVDSVCRANLNQSQVKKFERAPGPGITKTLSHWFPGQASSQIAESFEQSIIKMIQKNIEKDKARHEKVQKEIQRRIKEG